MFLYLGSTKRTKTRPALFLYSYLAHLPEVGTDGADHTGGDHVRFVDRGSGTKTFLPRPIPSLLFLVHSLELKDLTIFSTPPTILLGLNSSHSFFSNHGFAVPSGIFDREQAKTERHAHKWYTSGSAKD